MSVSGYCLPKVDVVVSAVLFEFSQIALVSPQFRRSYVNAIIIFFFSFINLSLSLETCGSNEIVFIFL